MASADNNNGEMSFDIGYLDETEFEQEMVLEELNSSDDEFLMEATELIENTQRPNVPSHGKSGRFPQMTDGEIDALVETKASKGTKRMTVWGVNQFKQWLTARNMPPEFEEMSVPELDSILRRFYAELRTPDGKLYSRSTYNGIRASLNRHIRSPPFNRNIALMSDEFHKSNQVFKATLKKLCVEGLDQTSHHVPISVGDLVKLRQSAAISTKSPHTLQRKVWFDLTIHFARRGCENIQELKRDAYVFLTDDTGREYVEMKYNEKLKNHPGFEHTENMDAKPRMYASADPSDDCPVDGPVCTLQVDGSVCTRMNDEESSVQSMACLESLPDESLVAILRYLHYPDLIRTSQTCCRLWKLSTDDVLWRWQCQHYFLENVCTEGRSWKQHFVSMFREFGKYPHYKEIKNAWTKVKTFCKENCPKVLASIQPGVSEADLDEMERKLGQRLPLDLRVSYRLHNGQNLDMETPGLMGGGMVSTHIRTDALAPLDSFSTSYTHNGCLAGCFILAQDQVNHSLQVMALNGRGGLNIGSVYEPLPQEYGSMGNSCFIKGDSFVDWFCSYADMLCQKAYYILQEHIFKFYHEPSCVATTAGITVKPTICFMPELSRVDTMYFFAYRIIMEMAEDAHPDLACRLEYRHWIIHDGNGKEEIVHGPGVIGKHPVMRPGKSFDWISCCTFETCTGTMEGHFGFRNLHTDALIKVECPQFLMEALPSISAKKRQELASEYLLTEAEHGSDTDS